MIGKTQAQLALSINEDPMSNYPFRSFINWGYPLTVILEELLYAEVQELNIADVANFGSDIIGIKIPEPPRDFLDFEEVKLYICRAGVTIGTTFYPQGFSFQADVVLFGKRANIDCGKSID